MDTLTIVLFIFLILLILASIRKTGIIDVLKEQNEKQKFFAESQEKIINAYFEDTKDDKLSTLFKRQIKLQKDITGIDLPADRPDFLTYHISGLVSELGEILDCDKRWKTWRKNVPPADYSALKTEIVDAWHFMINLSLVVGMDAETVFTEFIKKNEIIKERIKSGY